MGKKRNGRFVRVIDWGQLGTTSEPCTWVCLARITYFFRPSSIMPLTVPIRLITNGFAHHWIEVSEPKNRGRIFWQNVDRIYFSRHFSGLLSLLGGFICAITRLKNKKEFIFKSDPPYFQQISRINPVIEKFKWRNLKISLRRWNLGFNTNREIKSACSSICIKMYTLSIVQCPKKRMGKFNSAVVLI